MEKKLVHNGNEVVKLLLDQNLEAERIERLLGIEFAFASGAFPSDGEPSEEDDGTVHESLWRLRNGFDSGFPDSYPALAIHQFSDDFDRCGNVTIEVLFYVYPEDFR